MTMLLVVDDAAATQLPDHSATLELHECLQGQWALLFSNPQDFAPHASTPPGFMMCVADAMRAARTKPFAVIRRLEQSLATSWLHQIACEREAGRALLVLDCASGNGCVVDLATRALARKLRRLAPPYVLVLDEHGRCRSSISYRAQRIDRPRSIEELLCLVKMLRGDAGAVAHG